MPEIKRHLSFVALGAHRDKLAHDLVRAIGRRGCEILECRITPLGDHFSAVLQLAGNWSAVGKMESALPGLAEHLGLSVQFAYSRTVSPAREFRPYVAEIVAPQQPRLLADLMSFFAEQNVAVHEASMQAYQSSMTGADMCTIHISLHVPVDQHPQTLRDAFMDTCDELHADGLLDPIKT